MTRQQDGSTVEKEERLREEVHNEQILRILGKLSKMDNKELKVTVYLASEVLNL